MSLKTNILRIQAQGKCFCYQAHYNIDINEQDTIQVQSYLQGIDNNLIYSHPFLFANQPINTTVFDVLLSKGQATKIKFELIKESFISQILGQISHKILRSLQFMPFRKIKTYFNPFEEKDSTIPGLYIDPIYTSNYIGLAFLPVNLILQPPIQISKSKILLNYSNGRFYEISEIVRIDKQNNLIHFRHGQIIPLINFKKGKIKDVTGFELAEKLRNYFDRVKSNCKVFFQNWSIKLDANFCNSSASLVPVGAITFRENKDKQLSDLLMSNARNSYNHHFREIFKSCQFDSILEGQFVFLYPSEIVKESKHIIHQFEKQSERMSLKIKFHQVMIGSIQSKQQLVKSLEICSTGSRIYILIAPNSANSLQEENIRCFKEQMIEKSYYFHVIQYNSSEENDEFDIIALRNISILYYKLRLSPWKIKNIPFGDKPTVAMNINVQQTDDNRFSVAIIMTMNAFFSKFCCSHKACQPNAVDFTISEFVKQSLVKFSSHHKIFPFRIFLYRTGIINSVKDEHKIVSNNLVKYYHSIGYKNNTTITYILLNQNHPIRTFLQFDENFVTKSNVKKTQLLSSTVISNKFYLQLEFQEAPMQIDIYQLENDPSFSDKILQLTAKLCFGSVGNQFGKGIGFLGYAAKLNSYKQFSLEKWDKYLQDGVVLFL